MVDARRSEHTKGIEAEWQEFASFIVYFERKLRDGVEERRTSVVEQRTAIHHVETGQQSPH